jgi:aconitate hydratase
MEYPDFKEPENIIINNEMLVAPQEESEKIELEKGPNIKPLPPLEPMPDRLEGPVLLKAGDDISTDEIMPAGTKVLPFRSNIPEISKFTFSRIDETYYERAMKHQKSGSFIVGGTNYGQGSSREHAALGPRYLGLKAVIAKSFARIHWQNLCNFGILPLTFIDPDDWEKIERDDLLLIDDIENAVKHSKRINIVNRSKNENYETVHTMSARQIEMVLAGSLINLIKNKG